MYQYYAKLVRREDCLQCGAKLHRASQRLFCSVRCASQNRSARKTARFLMRSKRSCQACGTTFFPRSPRAMYCSTRCAGIVKRKTKPTCAKCGKPLRVTFAKFCSKTCRCAGAKTEKKCLKCGCDFVVSNCYIKRGGMAGSFCSLECTNSYRIADKNPNWRGGISFQPYPPEFNSILKRKVRSLWRDCCAICGVSAESEGYKLPVHHVDYDKSNCAIENLIPLCRACHGRTNGKRDQWERLLVERRAAVGVLAFRNTT